MFEDPRIAVRSRRGHDALFLGQRAVSGWSTDGAPRFFILLNESSASDRDFGVVRECGLPSDGSKEERTIAELRLDRTRWSDPGVEPGQLEYSREQLLATHPVEEPFVAGDVLCHGGFISGEYCSPRTLVRIPAIHAWKKRLAAEGHPLIYLPTSYVPPQYPNYEQTKLLLLEGVADPVVRAMTNVAIVEGFGARIRSMGALDLQMHLVEDMSARVGTSRCGRSRATSASIDRRFRATCSCS
jgi:hypothetical protein